MMARKTAHTRTGELGETDLPRRDSAIVVGVTAAIVGLLVLWMTQAGTAFRNSPADDTAAQHSVPMSISGE